MEGEKYHRWEVIKFDRVKEFKCGSKKRYWLCRCECGVEKSVEGQSLKRGSSKSCGCHNRETKASRATKHGMCGTPTFNTWLSMRRRCRDTRYPSYAVYGAAGITVCDEWYDNFETFYLDMGDRPDGMTLDRVDSGEGYFKENCRWATKETQTRNTRKLKITASKYKYVYRAHNSPKWVAALRGKDQRYTYLGTFLTQEDAARCSYKKYRELFGTWPPYMDHHITELGLSKEN